MQEDAVTTGSRKLVFVPRFALRALYYLKRLQTREENRPGEGEGHRAGPNSFPTSMIPLQVHARTRTRTPL